jgi:protein TonB
MTTRVVCMSLLALALTATPAAAQNGGGADVRRDATPPERPSSLNVPGQPQPARPGPNSLVLYAVLRDYPMRPQQTSPPPPAQVIPEFGKDAFKSSEPGLVMPVVLRRVNPTYTANALRAKIEGIVKVDAVIQPDGTIGETRIAQSLDTTYGLDQAALFALKRWSFEPGQLNGQPVPVIVSVVLAFRLH